MNTRNITSVVVAAIMLVTLASCGSSRSYPERRDYPNYPYPDGRTYPSRYPAHYPPGQVKKVYRYSQPRVIVVEPRHDRDWRDNDRRDDHHGKKYKKRSNRKY